MPEIKEIHKADLVILYTNIGRGHPSYLDGLVEILDHKHPEIKYLKTDVFKLSHGLSLAGWSLVRKMYTWGGRGGLITSIYGLIRKITGKGDGGGPMHRLLGGDLKRRLAGFEKPVVVAHPIIAEILRDQNQVIYQHGELAAPSESIIKGCYRIFVPVEETASVFRKVGIPAETLVVSGQCIETNLFPLAASAFEHRLTRIGGNAPLTAAIFSSGAYPRDHLLKIGQCAESLYRAGHTFLLFVGQSKKVHERFLKQFNRNGIEAAPELNSDFRANVIRSDHRQDENQKVASVFDRLDFFIAPAHERTNWAVGLGLPQFILEPHIGSYAPQNSDIALRKQVAIVIESEGMAGKLGDIVDRLRQDSTLLTMAQNGYGHTELTGFVHCVDTLAAMTG
jgi:hypothetical protein